MNKILSLALFLISSVICADDDFQKEQAKWELGLGIGVLSLPHYRGSDQTDNYIAPIPYIRFNGKRLKVDREGGRFYFYNTDDIKIDVSTAFALAVDSTDNRARINMPDLDLIIELGPKIQFNLFQSKDKNLRFRFAVPLRAAYATNFKNTENIGWVFSPYLQLRYFNSGWESAVSIGPTWASEKYHDYFYEVAQIYATVNRPAYDAKEGYSGSRITVTLSKRFDKFYLGMFAKYDDLRNTVFIDSPLVKQRSSLILGVAFSWVFIKSENKF